VSAIWGDMLARRCGSGGHLVLAATARGKQKGKAIFTARSALCTSALLSNGTQEHEIARESACSVAGVGEDLKPDSPFVRGKN
jgi:hypothetical protein